MKTAIMQPYFFPYIGYYQMVKAVDKFIFYDDVNFIKNGWINRNRILVNGQANYFTLQLNNASSFKLINEITFNNNIDKLLRTIDYSYRKAPYFNEIFELIKQIMKHDTNKVSDLAIKSIVQISEYLKLNTSFELSSEKYPETKEFEKGYRIIEICKKNNTLKYVNAIGGLNLYNKEFFKINNLELSFIKSNDCIYKQFQNDFVPWLSIIDILMFNSIKDVQNMLDNYELI